MVATISWPLAFRQAVAFRGEAAAPSIDVVGAFVHTCFSAAKVTEAPPNIVAAQVPAVRNAFDGGHRLCMHQHIGRPSAGACI